MEVSGQKQIEFHRVYQLRSGILLVSGKSSWRFLSKIETLKSECED